MSARGGEETRLSAQNRFGKFAIFSVHGVNYLKTTTRRVHRDAILRVVRHTLFPDARGVSRPKLPYRSG